MRRVRNRMLRRFLALLCFISSVLPLGAQMAEQSVVDLQRGLILHSRDAVNLGIGKDGLPGAAELRLKAGTDHEITDYTFACSIRFDHEPGGGGDHALEFASVAMQGGFMRLILSITPEGDVMARTDADNLEQCVGRPRQPVANRNISIAVSIKRDARQSLSGLWVDGVECESFHSPMKKETLDDPAVIIGTGALRSGIVSDIRLYNRALTRPEIIALAQLNAPKPVAEVTALLGSSEAVAVAESGWLEALLMNATKPSALRDLAWEGDTVFRQDRPLNFGPLEQQLSRVQAQRVMLMFGRQECLERGAEGLAAFRGALAKLVQMCPRGVVMVGTVPFEKQGPPLPDLSSKNAVLARYDEAMRAVTSEAGGTFIEVAQAWPKDGKATTRDGITLNAHGTRVLAEIIAAALGKPLPRDDSALEEMRALAVQKQALWHRYWRPSNWAFLYGDRTPQPSSRDHLNPNVRWFPQELEQYRALIEAKENELWKLSQEMGRKLP